MPIHRLFLGCSALALALTLAPAAAVEVATVPEGYVKIDIRAGTGTSRNLTIVSLPLQAQSTASGQVVGRITGITASTISNSNAGWTAGQLSQAASPSFIRITSGAASGRTFLISTSTPNTATTVTIDSTDAATDLTTLGIQVGTDGDTYEITPADTLSSVFGTPATTGVQGGANANAADNIQLYVPGSGWLSYYYNTTSGWLRIGPPISSGNVVIRPDTAVLYSRLPATVVSLVLVGRVPSIDRKALVANSGVTVLANYWPVDTTLAGSNIRNLPGWVTGAANVADTVQIFSPVSGWRQFYHNGTNWVRVGPPIVSDDEVIPTGSAVLISKRGSAAGTSVLTQAIPYSL